MEPRPFSRLIKPDERLMRAALVRAGTSDTERANIAADRVARMVATADLIADVPEVLVKNFERLRTLHVYGILCYDLFTIVADQALIITEQALGARLVTLYDHGVALVHKSGSTAELEARTFDIVYGALRGGEYSKGWSLRLRDGTTMRFSGSMSDLFRWARREGLLRGERNRHYELATARMRNHIAHPSGYHLNWEVDSARAIHELASLINHLWGAPASGNGRYARRIRREILAIGWDENAGVSIGRVEGLPRWRDRDKFSIAIVRASEEDDIFEYDSEYDSTLYPVDLLYGPASAAEALAWLSESQPEGDEVEFLDRMFLIRRGEDHNFDLPRRPELAVALDEHERNGEWFLVKADYPNEAFAHARNSVLPGTPCMKAGPCEVCAAVTVARGMLDDLMLVVECARGRSVRPTRPTRVQVPRPPWRR